MMLYLLFMLPPLIFMIWAQSRVSSAYKKYSRVPNMGGVTGAGPMWYICPEGQGLLCRYPSTASTYDFIVTEPTI